MQNDIYRPASLAALIERADIALDEIKILPLARAYGLLHVAPVPGREIVQADHRLIQLQQGFQEMRADEPGRTGDQPGARAAPDAILHFLVGSHRHSRLPGSRTEVS